MELHSGDAINIPAGVKHWHGAAPDSSRPFEEREDDHVDAQGNKDQNDLPDRGERFREYQAEVGDKVQHDEEPEQGFALFHEVDKSFRKPR